MITSKSPFKLSFRISWQIKLHFFNSFFFLAIDNILEEYSNKVIFLYPALTKGIELKPVPPPTSRIVTLFFIFNLLNKNLAAGILYFAMWSSYISENLL